MIKTVIIFFLTIISGFSIAQTSLTQRLTAANNQFALDLYQKLQESDKNLFFSPASVSMALLTTYEGSAGKTKSAFEKVLHLNWSITDREKSVFINSHTSKSDSGDVLIFSNSLWINKNFSIKEHFLKKSKEVFLAEARPLDVTAPEASAAKINQWVLDRTNNRIKDIIAARDITNETKMVLLNTVYFNAEWAQEFSTLATRPRKFYMLDGTEKEINSMLNLSSIKYSEDSEVQIIKIPYKGLKNSLFVILPKQKMGLPDFEKTFTISRFEGLQKSMVTEMVRYSLPKFKLENKFDLQKSLAELGLGPAFADADFSGISTKGDLAIGSVIHKTFIDVSEERTEAAAATEETVVVGYSGVKTQAPPPKLFQADHPFLFMVLNDDTGEILFLGKFVADKI